MIWFQTCKTQRNRIWLLSHPIIKEEMTGKIQESEKTQHLSQSLHRRLPQLLLLLLMLHHLLPLLLLLLNLLLRRRCVHHVRTRPRWIGIWKRGRCCVVKWSSTRGSRRRCSWSYMKWCSSRLLQYKFRRYKMVQLQIQKEKSYETTRATDQGSTSFITKEFMVNKNSFDRTAFLRFA